MCIIYLFLIKCKDTTSKAENKIKSFIFYRKTPRIIKQCIALIKISSRQAKYENY